MRGADDQALRMTFRKGGPSMSRARIGVFLLVLALVSSTVLATTILRKRAETRGGNDIATPSDLVEKTDAVVDIGIVAREPVQAALATPPSVPSQPSPSAASGPRIDPNTPCQYLPSYLSGYTPSEIQADGTQIYENVPFYVRQTDGTMRKQLSTVKIKPVSPAPLVDGEHGLAGR
jgi:hypothetical protein